MRTPKDKLALAAEQNLKEKSYWLNQLSGNSTKSTFPYDYQREKTGKCQPGRVKFRFPGKLQAKTMELSGGVDVKVHMILVTGLFILLDKYMNDHHDIFIGSPILKQEIQGEFVNTVLVFRNQVEDQASFKELLLQARETIVNANENQNYPLEILLDQLNLPVKPGEFPLFDVVILMENLHDRGYIQGIPYNMIFSFLKTAEHLEGFVEYNSLLYREATINQITRHYLAVLDQGLFNLDLPLFRIELLSPSEKAQILSDFNSQSLDYSKDNTLHELFAQQVENTPNHIALVGQIPNTKYQIPNKGESFGQGLNAFGVGHLSYRELNEKADQLVHLLKKQGVKPDTIVGIMMEPSLELVIGILAILKAGGAYLPIDPDYPEERAQYMLADSRTKVLLAAPEAKADLEESFRQPPQLSLQFIDIVTELSSTVKLPPSTLTSTCQVSPTNLAYIIYTSGSTGKPKGVLVEHRNVIAYLQAFYREFNINSRAAGIQLAPYSFDVFVEEVFPILLKGGRFIIPAAAIMMHIDSLVRLIIDHCVSIIDCTPLLLNEINKSVIERTGIIFISGGDVLKEEYIDQLLKVGTVYNTYGPTETTVCAAYYKCNGPAAYWQANSPGDHQSKIPPGIPIGKPICNYNIYILDYHGQLVPIGVTGELFISGPGVTRGYLNNPELTNNKFLTINFKLKTKKESYRFSRSYTSYKTSALYRTGDLANWFPDGNIRFVGRKDHQVKIRGYRVETGEIENRLLKKNGIKEAVVTAREDNPGDKYLCAYIVPHEEIELSGIKESLASELPHYMIPSFFVQLKQIPLTANGKIDRKALPEPKKEAGTAYVAPQNQRQKQVQQIWQEALGLQSIGIDDNFFDIGGHSLKGIQVLNRIHREFNVKIPLAEMFRTPTIKGLSGYIQKTAKDKFVSLQPVEKKEYYALSSAQKRLYILRELELESTAYNMPQVTTLRMKIEKGQPEHAFKKLIQRHEILRTSFEMIAGEPVQKINDHVPFDIDYYEVPGPFDKIIGNFVKPFDLSRAPLLRVGLTKTGSNRYILMLDMHHIITDAISQQLLLTDFMTLYAGEGEAQALAPLRIHYKDYAGWQNSETEREARQKQEAYWLKEFAGEIPVLNLPLDYKRPVVQGFAGDLLDFTISKEETQAMKSLAAREGSSLYLLLLTLFNVLLAKLSGSEDIVTGTLTAGRGHADLHQVIGMFVNTLVLRNYPQGHKTFKKFLAEVKEKTLTAFENQDYQFEDLVEKVAVKRNAGRNPLFDVMFSLDHQDEHTAEEDPTAVNTPAETNPDVYDYRVSKFNMTLRAREARETLLFGILYSTTLFKRNTIERFIDYFKKILAEVLQNSEIKLWEIEIITGTQKKQVLYDFNATETGDHPAKTLRQLFLEQVERTPDKIAVVGPCAGTRGTGGTGTPGSVSYRELDEKSNALAARLRVLGIGPGDIVAIISEPALEMMVAITAVLKSAGCYLPIDPENPPGRIAYMLKDSESKGLLTQKHLAPRVAFPGETLIIEAETPGPSDREAAAAADTGSPHDTVYMIYTSGTTGTPKGVLITDENLVNYVTWFSGETALTSEDRTVLTSSFAFDLGYTSIYPCLLQGGQLHILPKEIYMQPGCLLDYISLHRTSYVKMTPSLFSTLVDHPDFSKETCRRLRLVVLGGEAIDTAAVEKMHQACRHIKVMNHYGPTEATIGAIAQLIDFADFEAYKTRPTIGKPISNTKVFILDRYLKLLPPGIGGELCLSGAGVARGYFKREALTAEKFIANTFMEGKQAAYPYDRAYRTGDLACWLPDGGIEFLGRIDQQVKIRGFRVELAEIRGHLLNHPGIKEAVVLARTTASAPGAGDRYICAYLVPHSDNEPVIPLVRESLARDLPAYMIPAYFICLEKLPLTPNGKLDRNALPAPQPEAGTGYTAPGTPLEKKLAEIWSRVLEIKKELIGIDHNFFQMGGHSLKAVILLAQVQKEFNVKIPLAEIFRTPTIKGLSGYLREAALDRYAAIKAVEKKDYYALSPAQQRLYILQQMDLSGTSYNMPEILELTGEKAGEHSLDKLEKTFIKLTRRHESLRTSFGMMGDKPVQRIHNAENYKIQITNYRQNTNRKLQIKNIMEDFLRPFDLSRAPLLRVGLININHRQHMLLVDMHHIIADGISRRLLVTEFMGLSRDDALAPVAIHYKDFSEWQNSTKEKENLKQQEIYWLKQFAGDLPILDIPIDYPRPAVRDFEGSAVSFAIPPDHTAALNAMAREQGCTLYMVLLAITDILLAKLSNREDIVIGTPTAGRRHADLGQVIGMFVNTLALRHYPRGEQSVSRLLKNVKERTLDAFENQDYPFEDLVDRVGVNRDTARNPLFDVMFVMQNFDRPTGPIHGEPPPLHWHEQILRKAKFDITLIASETGESVMMYLEYCLKLFKKETIKRFITYFNTIVSLIVNQPGIKLRQIEILSRKEKERILFDFNATHAKYPGDKTLPRLFAEQVQRTPDHVALVGKGEGGPGRRVEGEKEEVPFGQTNAFGGYISITYRELDEKSNQLAVLLREKGVKPDTLVAIAAGRCLETIAGILGTLKAGGAYLPIDPAYPAERTRYMLADSSAALLIKKSNSFSDTPLEKAIDTLSLDDPTLFSSPPPAFNNRPKGTSLFGIWNLEFGISPPQGGQLAYVIYTSGTTGKPKGVLVEHRNVVRLVKNTNYLEFNEGDRILQTGALDFDASTFEIWGTLLNGLELHLAEKDITLTAEKLKETLHTRKISAIWMTSPLFNRMVDADLDIFIGLRNLLVGGDVLSPVHVKQVKQRFPYLRIINGYGPTENTTFSTTYSIDREHDANIPIGKPIANSTAYIVDKYDGLVPLGVEGELVVGGDGVARGYLNNPEMTNSKFQIANSNRKLLRGVQGAPLHGESIRDGFVTEDVFDNSTCTYHLHLPPLAEKNPPGRRRQKLYKTGDLARWLPEGNIEFRGRKDQQVKIRGFRIEPGEIQSQLLKNKKIKDAVVLAFPDKNREKYLCAYIIPKRSAQGAGRGEISLPPDSVELRLYLAKRLPGYMIPAFFIYLDSIPLTLNGKVDRKALPTPGIAAGQHYTAPANQIEAKLVRIWSEILGGDDSLMGVETDFFELGGHSLKAISLVSRIHKEFNVKVPLVEVFKQPFIRELSRYIVQAAPVRYTPLSAVEKKEYYPLSAAQKRLYVQQQMRRDSTGYNIPVMVRVEGALCKNKLENAFNRLIRRHEILRTSFQMQQKMPVQQIAEEVEFEVEYDRSLVTGHQSPVNCQGRVGVPSLIQVKKITRDFIRPFDLSKAPLLRVGIIKTGENNHLLMTDIHHIIADGTSMGILISELLLFYEERELSCLPFQYKDFSAWQQRLFESAEIKEQERYWLGVFAGDIPKADLPTDFPRQKVQRFGGSTIPFEINPELTAKLKQLAADTKATLFMVLLAVFNITLAKYSGKEDLVVGTPISGRNHAGLEQIAGMFVNMLALRHRPVSNQGSREFLADVKRNVLEAFENQDYPFDELVTKLNLQGASDRNPLFDVVFALQNIDTLQVKGVAPPADYYSWNENKVSQEDRQLRVSPYGHEKTTSKFDLLLGAVEAGAVISMSMEYSTQLFTPLTVEKITTAYLEILGQVVTDTNQKIKDISLSHHFQEIKFPGLKETRHEFKF